MSLDTRLLRPVPLPSSLFDCSSSSEVAKSFVLPVVLTGVEFADIASFISSNLLATEVAANLMVLMPPWIISPDFLLVKLGLDHEENK